MHSRVKSARPPKPAGKIKPPDQRLKAPRDGGASARRPSALTEGKIKPPD
jgi:hypothetical protein